MEYSNLKTLSKNIAAAKFKQASKIIIRDVDEESKNKFVAYADDKDESFDVAITLDENDAVIENDCDCEINGMCVHRIAFMVYLSTRNVKTKTKVVRAKKQTPTEILVNDLNTNALRVWVNELLKKNKDLELLFVNEFSVNNEVFDVEKVKSVIDATVKAVIKGRKKIDATELTKIIVLLGSSLKPVIEFCQNNIQTKEVIEVFLVLRRELYEFDRNLYIRTSKLLTFSDKILKQFTDYLSVLKDDSIWQEIVNNCFYYMMNNNTLSIYIPDFQQIKAIYTGITDGSTRKTYFIDKVQFLLVTTNNDKISLNVKIYEFILELMIENNRFKDCFESFKSVKYENDYNLLLIDSLIAIDQLDDASAMIKNQIMGNYYPEYNTEYWKKLKVIYQKRNDNRRLGELLQKLLPFDPNFEDYSFVKENVEADEFKTFRSKFLVNIKRAFSSNIKYPRFYFQVLNSENNYKKMIEVIDSSFNYELVYDYKEPLFTADKMGFIKAVCSIELRFYYNSPNESNLIFREQLLDWIIERYDITTIGAFIKINKQYDRSVFLDLIIEKFNNL